MKPIYLELQAFGPYKEKQSVDFKRLADKGMFLIKGPTGSGKTTIFDAMTFALYGGGSGENEKSRNARNDLKEWRCNQAEKEAETYVSFTFEVHGHTYRFVRRLIPKRVNLQEVLEAGEMDEEGNLIPFFNNPKKDDLNSKAVELIGLSKEQFRQVVLLPQGQFERFLTASSGEKEDILKKIFGAEQWDRYAQKFFAVCDEKKKALDREKDEINHSLSEDGVQDIPQLQQLIRQKEEDLRACESDFAAFDQEGKQKQLDADLQLSGEFTALHALEKKEQQLLSRQSTYEADKKRYQEAEKAEGLRRYMDEEARADRDKEVRQKALAAIDLQALTDKEETAKKAKEEHDKDQSAKQAAEKLAQYKSKEPIYENIDVMIASYRSLKVAKEKAEDMLKEKQQALDAAVKSAGKALNTYNQASERATDLRNRYYSEIYGNIAEQLEEGTPCPVCGSTHHPQPAVKTADSVEKTDVEMAEKAAENGRKQWDNAEKTRENAQRAKDEAQKDYGEKELAYTHAVTELQSASSSLIDGIKTMTALRGEEAKEQKIIDDYDNKSEELQKVWDDARERLTRGRTRKAEAETELKSAVQKHQEAVDVLSAALKQQYYASAEEAKSCLMNDADRTRLHKSIVEYETDVKTNKEDLAKKSAELQGKSEPDASRFADRRKEITETVKNYSNQRGRLSTDISRLKTKEAKLKAKWDHYSSEIHQAESDYAFAKKLKGDAGIGIQRYVLAIMFEQVVGEANRMLGKIHGGRYRLFRTDDKGTGNKRGLELKVHDNRSPEKEGRSVGMLSGGEKFLVSLALSIGMSTVAQKSGVQIEALFIDEGFGTLDEKSINDAMDVLGSVQRSNGLIGIISHVKLLEENIPTHVEVLKSEAGSRIVMN